MEKDRTKYRKYGLWVLIAVLGVVVVRQLFPVMSALLGATTLYVLLRGQMRRLVAGRHWRKKCAAVLLLAEAVVGFVLPFALVVWLVVREFTDLALNPDPLVAQLKAVADYVRETVGYDLWQEDNLAILLEVVKDMGQWVLNSSLDFALNIMLLPVVLYFMLLGGDRMEECLLDFVPFDRSETSEVVGEVGRVIRSMAFHIPLSAVIQGIMAGVGYWIFDVPSVLFWAVMTAFATMIPVTGAALVWFPMSLVIGINGSWGMAGGLMAWGVLAVVQVDNYVQRYVERKMCRQHPLVSILGVVVGLSLFGFMGLIFGPLLVALLVSFIGFFKRGYLDSAGCANRNSNVRLW